MYDCHFCTEAGTPYQIVSKPCPSYLKNGSDCMSSYTTVRVCTGCNRYDGPWIPAQFA